MKITRKGYYTITGPDGELLQRDSGTLQVTSRDECYEHITEDEREGVYTIHPPKREVLRTNLSHAQILPSADDVRILTISNISLGVGQSHDMSQYIIDPSRVRSATDVLGISGFVSYDEVLERLVGLSVGTETGLQLEVTF